MSDDPVDPPKSLITDTPGEEPPKEGPSEEPPEEPKQPAPEDEPPAQESLTIEDIPIPEGVELKEEVASAFLGIMNNADMSAKERAAALIDLQVKTAQSVVEEATAAFQAEWDQTQEKWQNETRALPEIGGDNLDKSLAQIKKGMMEAGASDEVFQVLDETGLGNHPAFVKLMHTLTKPLTEGAPTPGAPPVGKLSPADKMYGGNN